MNNWKKFRLGEVADVKLSNVDKKEYPNQQKIRLCNYTDVYKNAFIDFNKADNFMFATCSENEYDKFLLRKGQVAITKDSEKRDDIGISSYISEDFEDTLLGYHLSLITPISDKLDGKFLNYWFSTKQAKNYFENNAGGSGQRCTLTLDIIKSIPLHLPSINIQIQISKTLFDLDAKIELNNKINAELEAMAKTLYDYWFVQFDFPVLGTEPFEVPGLRQAQPTPQAQSTSKAQSTQIGYKSSGGKMIWNEELKREIPEGWEVKSIDEYAEVKKGELITAKDSEVGEIKVVAAGISYSYKHSKANREKHTITISGSGANAGFINFWREPIFASDCITVRGNTDTETLMILQHLKFIQAHILKQATGSAQPHVYPNDIKVLSYTIPPKELIVEFGKIIIPMNDKIAVNQKENQELASLRDWLLPMLMNGQVSVGEILSMKKSISKELQLAMIQKQIENKFKINYGEVVTQKTVFHLNLFTSQKLDYQFINSNYGTYSYQLKDDLIKNPYLTKSKKGNGEVFVLTSSNEKEVSDALSDPKNIEFVQAINEILKIYQTPLINKETENIELLNTVSKVIIDKQSTDLEVVYVGMQEWEIEQNGFRTKADKFTKLKTKKMIDLIEKLGLVDKLINI